MTESKNSSYKTSYKWFIFKINGNSNRTKVYLFRFIPFWEVVYKGYQKEYRLFGLRIYSGYNGEAVRSALLQRNILIVQQRKTLENKREDFQEPVKDINCTDRKVSPTVASKASVMICRVCGERSRAAFKATLMGKHEASYYFCDSCEHLQTQDPGWLPEAYSNAISDMDTGILQRNLFFKSILSAVISAFFDRNALFLDYAGGYGILTRLMRDAGFEFYWLDKYAKNIFANLFEYRPELGRPLLLTAIEVFEHLENPMEDISQMFELSDSILFSQTCLPIPPPKPDDWWYYALEGGQHISFYSQVTLRTIAQRYGKNYYGYRDIHLLTPVTLPEKHFAKVYRKAVKTFHAGQNYRRSLVMSDYAAVKELLSNHRNKHIP